MYRKPPNPAPLSSLPLVSWQAEAAWDAFTACLEKEADRKLTEVVATVRLPYVAPPEPTSSSNAAQPGRVKHFDRQYCAEKRVQRLHDSDESRRVPVSLPQPYSFEP